MVITDPIAYVGKEHCASQINLYLGLHTLCFIIILILLYFNLLLFVCLLIILYFTFPCATFFYNVH